MTNLLINGDFETGVLAPWIGFNASITTTDPIGTYCAELIADITPPNDVASISQTVTLVPGSSYTLRMWLNTILKESFVTIFENANQIALFVVSNDFWQEYVFGFTASAASTTILIQVFNNISILDDGLRIDDISLTLNEICFRGDSMVKVKNKQNMEEYVAARDIRAGEYLVFSTTHHEYVKLLHNVITGPSNRFCLIKQDSLGLGLPFNDFYVTSGHRIVHNGVEFKARNLPNVIKVKIPSENLYTFVTEERQTILINGLEVMAYGNEEWKEYQKTRGLIWREN
jgi:hypothetical protein